MAEQPSDDALEDASDLAELWQKALDDFQGSTKLDLKAMRFKSMEEAMESADQQAKKFNKFRHNDGKVDKVRSALGDNLELIEKIINVGKFAADTASVSARQVSSGNAC